MEDKTNFLGQPLPVRKTQAQALESVRLKLLKDIQDVRRELACESLVRYNTKPARLQQLVTLLVQKEAELTGFDSAVNVHRNFPE